MNPTSRVTVTLPADVVDEIDRRERNRSRFVLQAVRREIERRRRVELRRSLESPHRESTDVAELGLGDWVASLPDESAADIVDIDGGSAVRWVPGEGWLDDDE